MSYSAYTKFCVAIGYKVLETPHNIWIGRSYGFFNRMPLYETTPPSAQELAYIFKQHHILGINYAAEAGRKGKVTHNYFVRNRNYDLDNLDKKSRACVLKGLDNCRVRSMSFDELHRLGMPLNLDTLRRQGRTDEMFSNEDQWKGLCRAGEDWDQAEAWGAFFQGDLAAYLITIRLKNVVSVLYNHCRTSLLTSNSSSALLYSVIQTQMRTPGVEAVYNGTEWLTTKKGLDHFKQRMGFIAEPAAFMLQLRPIASQVLLNRGVRYAISSLGPLLLNNEFHQRVEAVLEMAELSS